MHSAPAHMVAPVRGPFVVEVRGGGRGIRPRAAGRWGDRGYFGDNDLRVVIVSAQGRLV